MNIVRHAILSMLVSMVGLYAVDSLMESVCVVKDAAATACGAGGVSLTALLVGGVVLMLVNAVVRPLLKLVALPFVVLTFGLFIFVVNGAAFWVAVQTLAFLDMGGVLLVTGGVLSYIGASVILGLCNGVAHWLLKR